MFDFLKKYEVMIKSYACDCRVHPMGSEHYINETSLGKFMFKEECYDAILKYYKRSMGSLVYDVLADKDEDPLCVQFIRLDKDSYRMSLDKDENYLDAAIDFEIMERY